MLVFNSTIITEGICMFTPVEKKNVYIILIESSSPYSTEGSDNYMIIRLWKRIRHSVLTFICHYNDINKRSKWPLENSLVCGLKWSLLLAVDLLVWMERLLRVCLILRKLVGRLIMRAWYRECLEYWSMEADFLLGTGWRVKLRGISVWHEEIRFFKECFFCSTSYNGKIILSYLRSTYLESLCLCLCSRIVNGVGVAGGKLIGDEFAVPRHGGQNRRCAWKSWNNMCKLKTFSISLNIRKGKYDIFIMMCSLANL